MSKFFEAIGKSIVFCKVNLLLFGETRDLCFGASRFRFVLLVQKTWKSNGAQQSNDDNNNHELYKGEAGLA